MSIKKTVHPRSLPGVHPGLQQRLREAEQAELKGETPRQLDGAQKILRPTPEASAPERRAQVRTIGLVEPAYRTAIDGLAALAAQDAFMPGANLDGIWDTLSEAEKIRAGALERFRLEMDTTLRVAGLPFAPPHKLGGRLDARALQRGARNLQAEIDSFGHLLAPDSRELLDEFALEILKIVDACLKQRAVAGLDAVSLIELVRDLVRKLIYQELASRQRAMGDRGIRRICDNIRLSDALLAQRKGLPGASLRDRLLTRIIHVHQDLGHVAYAARRSYRGSLLHRAYGARIFTDEISRFRVLLDASELSLVQHAIATHSAIELDFASQPIVSIVRAVDHLAPFAPHRVFKHLESLDGAGAYLDDLVARVADPEPTRFLAAKESLARFLASTDLVAPLRDDLMAAFVPRERGAEPYDLGPLAGQVANLELDSRSPGGITVTLAADPFAQKYQRVFDCQQGQLLRFVRESQQAVAAFVDHGELRLGKPGAGGLVLQRAP